MSQHLVAFIDMLGFSKATEDNDPPDIDTLKALRSASNLPQDLLDRLKAKGPAAAMAVRFVMFHRLIKMVMEESQVSEEPTIISFSDSAFVVSPVHKDFLDSAAFLMHSLIHNDLPVRMGIGLGTFVPVNFAFAQALGAGSYAAQFIGTGIVRAHAAESCGAKGMRILLNPSVEPFLQGLADPWPTLPLSRNEGPEVPPASAIAELNYLSLSRPGSRYEDVRAAVARMQSAAPAGASHQYTSTIAALDRMKNQLDGGEP